MSIYTNGYPRDVKTTGRKRDMKLQSREVGPGPGGIKGRYWDEYEENTL